MKLIKEIENEINGYRDAKIYQFNKKLLNLEKEPFNKDILLGVRMPHLRKIAKKYESLINDDILLYFLKNKVHEYRLFSLIIMTNKNTNEVIDLYLENLSYVDNWDLVDLSAPRILGKFLYENKNINESLSYLEYLYQNENPFIRRVAIVSTLYFIKRSRCEIIKFLKITIKDSYYLNHKALGWMLREIGKLDKPLMLDFIKNNQCPRITINYASEILSSIEKKS